MKVTLKVSGMVSDSFFSNSEIQQLHVPLLHQLTEQQKAKGSRLVVFLAAPPGCGKSTLSAFWEYLSNCDVALQTVQILPMDGFHHCNRWLDEHHLRGRKGAPETFDLDGLQQALLRLAQPQSYWPVYDRTLHDPVQDAITVTAPIVIVEGNWLLLDEPGWRELAQYSDVTLFIRAQARQLRARLIERKMRGGSTLEQAADFYQQTDGPNVDRVLQRSLPALITLNMALDGGLTRIVS
jgi:pantothenate kinase